MSLGILALKVFRNALDLREEIDLEISGSTYWRTRLNASLSTSHFRIVFLNYKPLDYSINESKPDR